LTDFLVAPSFFDNKFCVAKSFGSDGGWNADSENPDAGPAVVTTGASGRLHCVGLLAVVRSAVQWGYTYKEHGIFLRKSTFKRL
jgi:hypothetical protein